MNIYAAKVRIGVGWLWGGMVVRVNVKELGRRLSASGTGGMTGYEGRELVVVSGETSDEWPDRASNGNRNKEKERKRKKERKGEKKRGRREKRNRKKKLVC